MMNEDVQETQHSQVKSAAADFKVAIVLLLVSLFLILETMNYPMSGDYAGVESQWYVSPALFPLIVLTCFMLCGFVLLAKAIGQQGYQGFFSFSGWLGDPQEKRVRDRWLVIFLLAIYVYCYIPSIDFYLATTVFLLSLTARFYYETRNSLVLISGVNLLLFSLLLVIKTQWLALDEISYFSINQDEEVIFWSDSCAAIVISLLLLTHIVMPSKADKRKAVINTLIVLFVPLVLILIFSYLLFVPMPVEYGSVVSLLDHLVYEVLAL